MLIKKPKKINNKVPVLTLEDAVELIPNAVTLYLDGASTGYNEPTSLFAALAKRFKDTGEPKDLILYYINGVGDRIDSSDRGYSTLALTGMIKRMIGGHLGQAPKLASMAFKNKVEAYNLPMGVMSQLLRCAAARQPGLISSVGLHTFMDPRQHGGKLNERTTEDLIELINIKGKEYLLYYTIPLDVAFLAASTADTEGYITMEDEALFLDELSAAQAVHNNGGLVIVQVRRIVKEGTLHPKLIKIPGNLVDAIVVVPEQPQSYSQAGKPLNRFITGDLIAPENYIVTQIPLNERKVIARRGLFESKPGDTGNTGVGIAALINPVAQEEGIHKSLTLTTEIGEIGGINGPPEGVNFGVSSNMKAIIPMSNQFDFYDGGGLDIAYVSFAQVDQKGNVNVHIINDRIMGTGGFSNITANCKKLVFGGTMTSGGLKTKVGNGKIEVIQEGQFRKFLSKVDQITFSGENAVRNGKQVFYVTERCVFRLTIDGLELIEIAPGIDSEKDILPYMDFTPNISNELKFMDKRIFIDKPMCIHEEWLNQIVN